MNPYSTGYHFGGPAAQRLQQRLKPLARENARRVPCNRCGLHVLPEGMARHLSIVHDDEAA